MAPRTKPAVSGRVQQLRDAQAACVTRISFLVAMKEITHTVAIRDLAEAVKFLAHAEAITAEQSVES